MSSPGCRTASLCTCGQARGPTIAARLPERTAASAHGFGIAIDIAAAHSHYWLRAKPGAAGHIAYKNEIPWEIVRIFEAHGFIWGGKWYHYDTMHFEYRPELIGATK